MKRQTTLLENMFYLRPMTLGEFWRHPIIRGIYDKRSESTRKRDISRLVFFNFVKYEKSVRDDRKKISVNWDALKLVTPRREAIPHGRKLKYIPLENRLSRDG